MYKEKKKKERKKKKNLVTTLCKETFKLCATSNIHVVAYCNSKFYGACLRIEKLVNISALKKIVITLYA